MVLWVQFSHTDHWMFNMAPHGKELSEDLRIRIVALHKDGLAYKKFGNSLELSYSTVARVIQRFSKTGFHSEQASQGLIKEVESLCCASDREAGFKKQTHECCQHCFRGCRSRRSAAGNPELYQSGSWLGRAGGLLTMKWRVSTSGRTVSSLRELWVGEDGLNNLGWETGSYELCPLRGHTQNLHSSGWGCLLTGISHGEPSRREIRSENHTQPGQNGATSNRRTPSRHTLARTPGSRAIGGKVYRRSLGQVCTIASSPRGAGGVRENQRGHCDVSWVAKRSTWAWPKTLHICFTTLGWSIHSPGLGPCLDRMSAHTLSCPEKWTALSERSLVLGPHKDLVCQLVQGHERRPPWWLI